jgi:hypothetical protein
MTTNLIEAPGTRLRTAVPAAMDRPGNGAHSIAHRRLILRECGGTGMDCVTVPRAGSRALAHGPGTGDGNADLAVQRETLQNEEDE